MGRKKLEMKRIEDKSSRQVTFSKRRSGLVKKARELSVLCDVDLALIIFSCRGKLYDFCAGNHSLAKILQRYQNHIEAEGNISKDADRENYRLNCASFGRSAELLQIVESHLAESNVELLSITDLIQLEKELDDALIQTRSRKTQLLMESLVTLSKEERMLREENEFLANEIAAMKESDNNVNEAVIEFNNLGNSQINRHPSQLATLSFALIE